MNKRKAKEHIEAYIRYLRKNINRFSQELSVKIRERGDICSINGENDECEFLLMIKKKWKRGRENE